MRSSFTIILICVFVLCIIVHLEAFTKSRRSRKTAKHSHEGIDMEMQRAINNIKIEYRDNMAEMYEKIAEIYQNHEKMHDAATNFRAAAIEYQNQGNEIKAAGLYVNAARIFENNRNYLFAIDDYVSASAIYKNLGYNHDSERFYKMALDAEKFYGMTFNA